ncbi:MAG: PDZ domain-containing protein [Terracidiphilus sp.]
MNHFSRPYRSIGIITIGLGTWLVMMPGVRAQSAGMIEVLQDSSPMLLHSSASQGYLGVDFVDVDQDKAQALKLKEVRGAVITLIDHDAPAGQAGMRVNDVVIQLNGQNVEGAEQLKRMLREIPPGHKVSIEISRDGNVQTMAVELVDHRVLGHDIWKKIGHDGDDGSPSTLGMLTGTGDTSSPSVFKMPIFGSTLNVGAMVEPLTSQMADYLGVPNGLMVKQVARKSEAAAAGLKAFDVILKVGTDAISTSADWERALHANTGKPVQVTILRDRKQQTLTLQVDSKRKTGQLEMEDLFGDGSCPLMADLDKNLEGDAQLAAELLSKQAQALKDSIKIEGFKVDPKQAEELKKQMEEFSKNFNGKILDVDPKLAAELGKSFTIEDFKVDPKQAEELKKQMEDFSKNFKAEDFKIDQKQLDEMKKQMEEFGKNFEVQELQTAPY